MKKFNSLLLAITLVLSISACSSSVDNSEVSGTYDIYVAGYDYGCGVDKATLTLDKEVSNVDKTDFKVEETKQVTDWSDESYPVIEQTAQRTINDAYTVDKEGNKTTEASKYVVIEMNCDPNEGSPLLYSMSTFYNTWSDPYYLTITLTDETDIQVKGTYVKTLDIETEYKNKTTAADVFEQDSFTGSDNVVLDYGLYQPEDKTDTLVVWLHGAGEGGSKTTGDATDPSISCLGNKVTALAGEEFQSIVGASSVLVPQCPTMWQDYNGNGPEWAENGYPVNILPSYYLQTTFELIEKTKNEVGAKNVVIAGCSGGGYMTMALILAHPDYFAAAVPICEGYFDTNITDEQIKSLVDLPMYFIYSLDDTTALPELFCGETIKRLQAAGASNLHVSTTEHVVDTSNTYNYLNDGNQYQYAGHWSWIYFDNNESQCNDCNEHVFEWIAEQVK